MQVKNINVQELLGRLRLYFQENDLSRKYTNEEPLRAELYNTDQLEQHAKYIAKAHKVKPGRAKDKLLKRLASNEKILIEVRNLLTETIKDNHLVTPAGEWLLDNFYLIEEHIVTGKRHLPKGYSEGLPNLISGPSEGLPRVYDIALDIISHSDGRIDLESLSLFITAYQSVTHLRLGELWAIPIMLRLALIENLRRVAVRVALDRVNQNLADYWATLMTTTAENDPKSLILVIADMARSGPPMESSFVSELMRQLMWKGPGLALPLTWVEQRLSEKGLTSNELVNMENQKQAADQVSISNSIGSLRFLGSIEWHEFVESMSVVEQTLRKDVSGVYPSMDFATRDTYRHVVERISKNSEISENEVALIAIRLAEQAAAIDNTDERTTHVGYYLVGECRSKTEKLAKQKVKFKERLKRAAKQFPLTFYAGSIVVIALAVGGYMCMTAYRQAVPAWVVIVTGICAILAATHLATALINWLATMLIRPDAVPKMDFSKGIPDAYNTLVVVPTMLSGPASLENIVEALEVRFLANRYDHLHYGLLTDFPDAATETLPADNDILELATTRINELNDKYGPNSKFFLFHRPRKWNPHDKVWMGYERKRGKLSELNALLRGKNKDYFSLVVGDIEAIPAVKYIITLDTDTQLPRDAAWKLVGAMAHPLNHPVYDQKKQRITKGYGILQPRVSVSLSMSGMSLYAQMHGNEPGIDPYTRITSDVYQDLFDEGSFIGKGIYDIDAFETALNNRLPENRILSHDLLEGCYTRAGLLTDVQLYEEYPVRYSADVNRRHRWIRGDWQIGYWSLPAAPDNRNRIRKNPLSALSKWKIFDNLRRSLVPLALTSLLLLSWTVLHQSWFWALSVILIVFLPSLVSSVWNVFRKSKEVTLWQHLYTWINSLADSFLQNAFMFVCLPYEAYYSVDAIMRTGWRMLISHKKLLEWNPSANHEHTSDKTLSSAYRAMWISPSLSVIIIVYLAIFTPMRLFVAVPVLSLWALSPFIAWWVSKPFNTRKAVLTAEQTSYLRKIARKTWAFFETFVDAEDNWLPPDNYQERPNNVIAHRTSPTNIGLALLANLSAYDFGYITTEVLTERTENTMNTLEKLERYRGHLYNWYDTVTLNPLLPRYVSTVDSGNMAGHLLTLRQGLLSLPGERIVRASLFEGLLDTIDILEQEAKNDVLTRRFRENINSILKTGFVTAKNTAEFTKELQDSVGEIASHLVVDESSEANWWLQKLTAQCVAVNKEVVELFPWVWLPPTPLKFEAVCKKVEAHTLLEVSLIATTISPEIEALRSQNNTQEEAQWLTSLQTVISEAAAKATARISKIEVLAEKCEEFADVDYDFLYDRSKQLLTIGFNVEEHQRDTGYYDLLASEARLCSFVAIAQGKLPQESWFALGRLLTNANGNPTLLSWSGSMFEYLMPLLVMPAYEQTLIDQTHKAAVARQIEYGAERNVPWGISESGYNMTDANLNYQYKAFGVPGLGLKRGLGEDLVIAPYASVLALMVSPEEACQNMKRLSADGYEGRYGLYEAIDYTPSRLPRGQSSAMIQSFMAHHQGMSFGALGYALLGKPMQKRFESELRFQATMLLLQERIPKLTTYYAHATDIATINHVSGNTEMRVITTPDTPIPEIQLLSNGKYHVMVTNAGGGYSKWKDIAVTRWREDTTCDNWGTFCYIRDLEEDIFWSNAHQPSLTKTKNYEAVFTQGRAEFRRRDNYIETTTEVVVSPEDDIEMRRIHITNRSRRRRTIEITTYAEVVLNTAAADVIHPAFSNLFIQTEIIENRHAILCTRRPRSVNEAPPSMFHLVTTDGAVIEEVSYETDRMKFTGRGNSIATPSAMHTQGPLSNSQGSVLDPIVSVRYLLTLKPDETVIIDIITGISETREGCMGLIEKYQDKHHKDRVFELAWTHSQVVLRQINATEADAQLYGQLASSIIYTNPSLRADPSILIKNKRGQSGLWGYSISGDHPIVLLQIEDQNNIELVKQLVQAHAYWRLKGLIVDLVIWNEDHGGYRQVLQNQILGLIAAGTGADLADHPGGIFVRAADQISNEDRILFQAVARICICDKDGTLEEHIRRKNRAKNTIPHLVPVEPEPVNELPVLPYEKDLQFFNGLGGFSADGREYVIITEPGNRTPAPWSNVLANPRFGTVISESGQSYTWLTNAHEYRLTPWENDPVCDKSGEMFYLRDEDSGHFWSPTPLHAGGKFPYRTTHGFGYSVFEHDEEGIVSEMCVFVDIDAAVKFFVLNLKNNSGATRHLSATGFIEWILGDKKSKTAMHIVTEIDATTGALFARNPYNTEFTGYTSFFDTDDAARSFTADRAEFIGRNGTLANPDAMSRVRLSGTVGAALDPCAALQTVFVLGNGQERTVVFRLGAGKSLAEAGEAARQFKSVIAAQQALEKVKKHWAHALGSLQIHTPDPALNILANGWLMYQTIACRLWARSGYYQSGGAFGFRDQLQDVLAVIQSQPHIARQQILLCAARQFKEGDVQHWWHPPAGRGVRTRCSDDFLWLPYVTAGYVVKTGDTGILDEQVQFLEGRLLNHDEESYYDLPVISDQSASVYEHCVRAIQQGLKFGTHGLPLMGSGDWNDGMDQVGKDGKGESIWLAFFLYEVLTRFAKIATMRSDSQFADVCTKNAAQLKANIEKNGWDGGWYRRAYFDDGTPLGSIANDECQIDSISQSWSVISGAGSAEHTHTALAAADKRLVNDKDKFIQLLDPPFDKSPLNPGYIKGYVPGIRENGGQYTHAAVWMVMAYAKLNNAKRAWELINIINPINHGRTKEEIAVYKVEPYVAAADVYSISQNKGRGGWTWYTGSAGWTYQLIIDWLLGIKQQGTKLTFAPCIPAEWDNCKIDYRFYDTMYHITVTQSQSITETMNIIADGAELQDKFITLVNDKMEHNVEIKIGRNQ